MQNEQLTELESHLQKAAQKEGDARDAAVELDAAIDAAMREEAGNDHYE